MSRPRVLNLSPAKAVLVRHQLGSGPFQHRACIRHRCRGQADADQPDPIVRDNLGDPVPITAAEVDAIETYLGPMLRDLLADVAPPRKDKR
jgi:hypothetical protein